LTERQAGSEATNVQTIATRVGEHYVLNGQKCFITNAPVADLFTVIARTQEGSQGSQGLSAFIVERGSSGLSVGQPYRKMGQAGSPVSDVLFENCRVPATNLIGGREGVGFQTVMKVLNKQRLHLAALCTGPAIRMLDLAMAHTQQRVQFGQPVANFQLVQAMIADSQTEIYAARSMILETARARDRGEDVALSANSALIEAALALLIGFTSASASSKVVRRSSPYFSATAASSAETRSRKAPSLLRIRWSSAISPNSWAFSDSSSIFENLVKRRNRSSRIYSA
jgi:alkylation response protein AidB-like acyl-CoA dehydrogenase